MLRRQATLLTLKPEDITEYDASLESHRAEIAQLRKMKAQSAARALTQAGPKSQTHQGNVGRVQQQGSSTGRAQQSTRGGEERIFGGACGNSNVPPEGRLMGRDGRIERSTRQAATSTNGHLPPPPSSRTTRMPQADVQTPTPFNSMSSSASIQPMATPVNSQDIPQQPRQVSGQPPRPTGSLRSNVRTSQQSSQSQQERQARSLQSSQYGGQSVDDDQNDDPEIEDEEADLTEDDDSILASHAQSRARIQQLQGRSSQSSSHQHPPPQARVQGRPNQQNHGHSQRSSQSRAHQSTSSNSQHPSQSTQSSQHPRSTQPPPPRPTQTPTLPHPLPTTDLDEPTNRVASTRIGGILPSSSSTYSRSISSSASISAEEQTGSVTLGTGGAGRTTSGGGGAGGGAGGGGVAITPDQQQQQHQQQARAPSRVTRYQRIMGRN